MIYTTSEPEQLAKEIAVAKAHRVPIFMDAADGNLPLTSSSYSTKWAATCTPSAEARDCADRNRAASS
jgi:hypothetical protein